MISGQNLTKLEAVNYNMTQGMKLRWPYLAHAQKEPRVHATDSRLVRAAHAQHVLRMRV